MTASNVTTAKAAPLTAKNKQPSKAELARKLAARLKAKAQTESTKVTLDEARAKCVTKTGEGMSAARVYAFALVQRFGADWYTFSAANSRTDNEKAHFAAIEVERKACMNEYAAKYGEEGKNVPWSRAKAICRQWREGGEPRPGKPLDAKQKIALIALYKAAMKEERPTDQELTINDAIGRLLVTHFHVDLSQYG